MNDISSRSSHTPFPSFHDALHSTQSKGRNADHGLCATKSRYARGECQEGLLDEADDYVMAAEERKGLVDLGEDFRQRN
jgi:hypothetical protein